jgi:chromate transporter
LTGITAAVVGVIANLAIFFAVHTLFGTVNTASKGPIAVQAPDPTTLQVGSLAITALAGLLLFRRGWSVLRTLGGCALIGLVAGVVEMVAGLV